jgi:hypothetical protein
MEFVGCFKFFLSQKYILQLHLYTSHAFPEFTLDFPRHNYEIYLILNIIFISRVFIYVWSGTDSNIFVKAAELSAEVIRTILL